MVLRSDRELEIAKKKLRNLQTGYEEARADVEDAHLREIEMESLGRLMNQLKEQIARYESRRVVPTAADMP